MLSVATAYPLAKSMAEILLLSMLTIWPIHLRNAPARDIMACIDETAFTVSISHHQYEK